MFFGKVDAVKNRTKHILDFIMTVILLTLMAYPITGEAVHEWLGIAMFAAVVAHNLLNLKWYAALFKGKYSFLRVVRTVINVLLFTAMLGTAVSGFLMNHHVLPLSIPGTTAAARILHLAGSYWSFVLMSAHLGLHWGMIMGAARKAGKGPAPSGKWKIPLRIVTGLIAAYGLWEFIRRGFLTYMLMQTHFAFFDFSEPAPLFYLNHIAIMGLFVAAAYYLTKLLPANRRKGASDQ